MPERAVGQEHVAGAVRDAGRRADRVRSGRAGHQGRGILARVPYAGAPLAARLASVAGAGEILVSVPAARHASLEAENLERRVLTLKGKAESVQVIVLT